jgi:hypothetical protein
MQMTTSGPMPGINQIRAIGPANPALVKIRQKQNTGKAIKRTMRKIQKIQPKAMTLAKAASLGRLKVAKARAKDITASEMRGEMEWEDLLPRYSDCG